MAYRNTPYNCMSPKSEYYIGVVLFTVFIPFVSGCGAYLQASASVTNSLSSPNYPNAYPSYTRCIWLIEAPAEHQVQMNITFEGEDSYNQCSDYIEVRDGSILSELHLSTCSANMSTYYVVSTARWLWMFFKSDGRGSTSGLHATYAAVYAGSSINNISSPVRACRTHEVSCSNKECLSMSYSCDGFNDCGCGPGCDEDECDGLKMGLGIMYAIGSCVALVLFVGVCMGVYIFERKFHWAHIKKHETSGQIAKK